MTFILKKMTHNELVEAMEKATLQQTGIPLTFHFELCSDGNLDLYRKDNHQFSLAEISKLVSLGWVDQTILEENKVVDPFEWDEDTLAQSHQLFYFMLKKTFGEDTEIAGVEELDDCVLLNVAIPR